MVQWNNVNRRLSCEETGAIALALANWSYSRLAGKQNAEFKIIYWTTENIFSMFDKIKCYNYSHTNAFFGFYGKACIPQGGM